MRKVSKLFIAAVLGSAMLFTSCDKEDLDGGTDGTSDSTSTSDSLVVGDSTVATVACKIMTIVESEADKADETKTFAYNADGMIASITIEQDSNDTMKDSMMYTAGVLTGITHYAYVDTNMDDSIDTKVWMEVGTITYEWDGTNLATITSERKESHHVEIDSNTWEKVDTVITRVTTITYADNKATSIVESGERGMGFYNVMWDSLGNITSIDMGPNMVADTAGNLMTMSLSFDDKPNSFRRDIPRPGGEIFAWLCTNNYTKITAATEIKFDPEAPAIPAGTDVMTRTLTYGSNNEVTKIVEVDKFDSEGERTKTMDITWDCN